MNKIKLFLVHQFLANARKKVRKKAPWIGKQFWVSRTGEKPVETFLYEPKEKLYHPMPVMFNIHGGAWVGSDATGLDEQSQKMADTLSAFVVNINYKKVDEEPFPYCQQEVADVVRYFYEHAEQYGVDKEKFNLIGYSAGGHICAGAAILLKDAGIKLCSNIPTYPFLDFTSFEKGATLGLDDKTLKLMNEVFFRGNIDIRSAVMSPGIASPDDLKGLSDTYIILCGPDELYQQGLDYQKCLQQAGVNVEVKVFEPSKHGFMEGNYSEIKTENDAIQKEQMEQCFLYLKDIMHRMWNADRR